ncbi:MAG: hypothetical protein A2015_05730 [Spirochaetes bacterium GWF1_31_7]|nr:MAG: hypothetical protein A2Y30_00140 [Spirochaetes bacterium GWE1_32_154]OHD47191.1 MAG: hypothetical protein A2Y29_10725 [Spirochaetes bacterium GWE2_31_10]OHD48924.1 MAG: hypothetical protein A2015_05730 [Spirochaetes bacterium GWF1_31_7]OHD76566.1 MAG: hypothetical protein A2355_15490 [Spirochaetes bacterium RIFOXYB1_FULL_32_8]HBD92625.1 N-formylglutamate amidohydrolase [Spirochaetia bacterium]
MFDIIVLTCEHATNFIPDAYTKYFMTNHEILDTHQGYDIGADLLAQSLSGQLSTEYLKPTVSRLLIDCNRSICNKSLISSCINPIDITTKETIITGFYIPYRNTVSNRMKNLIDSGKKVLHFSVHSFTPILNGIERDADIGILYDPKRPVEKEFATSFKKKLQQFDNSIVVKSNYPYKGTSDGFTTFLRTHCNSPDYCGIELEVNQKIIFQSSLHELIGSALRCYKKL